MVGEYDRAEADAPTRRPTVQPIENIRGQLALTARDAVAYAEAETVAFFVVGQRVDITVLQRLATSISIDALAARIATIDGLTAIQLWGDIPGCDALPYAFAVALQNALGSTPIALVELDADRAARYLVLTEPPARDSKRTDPERLVRRAFDIALGHDPGTGMLHDLLVELGAAPQQTLRGTERYLLQLTSIDPTTPSCFLPDADDDADDHDEDEDEDEDDDYEYEDDEYDTHAEQFEEPAIAVAVVEVLDDSTAIEPEAAEVEDALVSLPEREESWSEFREHWDDRAPDTDDAPPLRRPADLEAAIDIEGELDRLQLEHFSHDQVAVAETDADPEP